MRYVVRSQKQHRADRHSAAAQTQWPMTRSAAGRIETIRAFVTKAAQQRLKGMERPLSRFARQARSANMRHPAHAATRTRGEEGRVQTPRVDPLAR